MQVIVGLSVKDHSPSNPLTSFDSPVLHIILHTVDMTDPCCILLSVLLCD